jgi:hypothetical protein
MEENIEVKDYEALLPYEERYLNVLVAQICAEIDRDRHPEAGHDAEELKRIGKGLFIDNILKKVS